MQPLLIRTDVGTNIGHGHLMRCLALAESWKDSKGPVTFAVAELPSSLEQKLTAKGMDIIRITAPPGSVNDAFQVTQLTNMNGIDWVVVDGYHFGSSYQRIITDSDLSLLWIDDNGDCDHYYADIILNQNIHASQELYPKRESYTQLLLGTKYVLLRKEFLKSQITEPNIPDEAGKILVTLGGGDPDNVTLNAIQALQQLIFPEWEAKVVVGTNYPHYQSLEKTLKKPNGKIELIREPDQMPELMQWADISLSGGGSTCWELAYMGVPGILLVIADNQLESARMLANQGVFLTIENATQTTPEIIARTLSDLISNRELRKQLSHNANQLIDGNGSSRVITCTSELVANGGMT